jgi:hypothetical protein
MVVCLVPAESDRIPIGSVIPGFYPAQPEVPAQASLVHIGIRLRSRFWIGEKVSTVRALLQLEHHDDEAQATWQTRQRRDAIRESAKIGA